VIKTAFAQALEGSEKTGPNPSCRAKPGIKHHMLIDAHGIPLVATMTEANVNVAI
jgi:hypothetical protein